MKRVMKESGIEWAGDIPAEWKVDRLQWHLIEINKPNNPIETTYVLSLNNKTGVIPYDERDNMGNKAKEDYSEYKVAYPNTLVMNSMNVIIGSVGISNYYGCVSPVYYVFKSTEGTDLRYINYIFQTEKFQKELRKYANGILEVRLRISVHDTLRRLIPVPRYEEQVRIANLLDDKISKLDCIIDSVRDSIEEYKHLKVSVITQAVTKGISKADKYKNSGLEWAGEIPEDWSVTKISRVGKTSSGATPLRSKDADYFDEATIRWVRTLDLNDWLVNDSSEKITELALENSSCSIMPKNTVCVAMYGGGGTIGKCGLLTVECATNQAVCSIVCDKSIICPQFLLFELLALKKYWMLYAVGTRKDPNISQDIVGKMKIVLPSIEEQRRIVEYLTQKIVEVDDLVAEKEKYLSEVENYKKSLIYEYVTGKKEADYD